MLKRGKRQSRYAADPLFGSLHTLTFVQGPRIVTVAHKYHLRFYRLWANRVIPGRRVTIRALQTNKHTHLHSRRALRRFPWRGRGIGAARFPYRLARAFLTECPSQSYTTRNLASRLPAWLEVHPGFAKTVLELAFDMARLE